MDIHRRWIGTALLLGGVLAACEGESPGGADETRSAAPTPDAPASGERDVLATVDPSDDATTPRLACGGELSKAPVALDWRELVELPEARVDRDAKLVLQAHNTSRAPVTVRPVATVTQHGAKRVVELEPVALDPDERRSVVFAPSELGIDRTGADFSGHLAIRGAVVDADGRTIMTVYAPGRSFHAEPDGDVLVFYDRETRDRKYQRGDLSGLVPAELRDDPGVRSIGYVDGAAPIAAGGLR